MAAQALIKFPFNADGLREAKAELSKIEALLEGTPHPDPQQPSAPPNPAVVLWQNVGPSSRTREILKLLPNDPAKGKTPDELAQVMRPDSNGARLKKASVRAAILNARRVEKRLRSEGKIDREVIVADGSHYDDDDANRYHLRPEDSAAIKAL